MISGAILDPKTFLKDQLMLRAVDTLELCLVCEVCWRPQRDGAYDVTTQSDLCAKVCAHSFTLRNPHFSSLHDACGTGDAGCEGNTLHNQGGEWAGRHRAVLLSWYRSRSQVRVRGRIREACPRDWARP